MRARAVELGAVEHLLAEVEAAQDLIGNVPGVRHAALPHQGSLVISTPALAISAFKSVLLSKRVTRSGPQSRFVCILVSALTCYAVPDECE